LIAKILGSDKSPPFFAPNLHQIWCAVNSYRQKISKKSKILSHHIKHILCRTTGQPRRGTILDNFQHSGRDIPIVTIVTTRPGEGAPWLAVPNHKRVNIDFLGGVWYCGPHV